MTHRYPSTAIASRPLRSGLQHLVSVVAAGLTVVLWSAGHWTVVSPLAAQGLFLGTVVCGVLSVTLAFRPRWRPWPVMLSGLTGLAALIGAVLFAVALASAPDPPTEHFVTSPPLVNDANRAADRHLRVLQWSVEGGDLDSRFEEQTAAIAHLLQNAAADVVVLQIGSLPGRQSFGQLFSGRVASEQSAEAGRGASERIGLEPGQGGGESMAKRLADALAMHAVYTRSSGSRRLLGYERGVLVLSRYAIRSSRRMQLARSGFSPRPSALLAEIDGPRGVFSVLAFDLNPTDPSDAASLVRGWLAETGADDADSANTTGGQPLLIAGSLGSPNTTGATQSLDPTGYKRLGAGSSDHLLVREGVGWRELWDTTLLGSTPGQPRVSDRPILLAELVPTGPPASSAWRGSWDASPTLGLHPEQPGFNRARFDQSIERIGDLEGVEAVLVARGGELLAETYSRGAARDGLRNVKSVSKSVLSAVIGVAVERGDLELSAPISRYLAEAQQLDDPLKRSITVEDLLGMRSGLESTSFGNYGSWVSSRNWVANALARPLVDRPGTRRRYSTGDSHLLSAVLAAATGTTSLDYAMQHFYEPLGIARVSWQRDPQGIHLGGNNLRLRARDMLRIGQLFLDRGRFGEQQILSHDWVRRSTSTQRHRLSGEWGRYGWLWWLRPPNEKGAYSANGFGGQHLYISPAHELVVFIGSTETSKRRGWRQDLFEQIVHGIAGSMEQAEGPLVGVPLR